MRLPFSRIASYAFQVLPSKASNLIHLLDSRLIAFATCVGFKGVGNLLHEMFALENVKRFLFLLPVVGTDHNKSRSGSLCYLDRLMPTSHLLYNAFQIASEFVGTDGFHSSP